MWVNCDFDVLNSTIIIAQMCIHQAAEWKWEHIMMDFVTHLPRTSRGHDLVWVIVDRLTKLAHFLAMQMTFTLEQFCRLYIREIVQLHGLPLSIVSDWDPRFTAHF